MGFGDQTAFSLPGWKEYGDDGDGDGGDDENGNDGASQISTPALCWQYVYNPLNPRNGPVIWGLLLFPFVGEKVEAHWDNEAD